jgi:hypothetical protein
MDLCASFGLTSVDVDGCAFGLKHNDRVLKKPWKIVTDRPLLSQNLAHYFRNGQHQHMHISGSITAKTGFYTCTMCHLILSFIFPYKMSLHIPVLVDSPPSEESMPSKGTRGKRCENNDRTVFDGGAWQRFHAHSGWWSTLNQTTHKLIT